jgi:hypothetical protein
MKKHLTLLIVIGLLAFAGCAPAPMPNLVLQSAEIVPFAQAVTITEQNTGDATAAAHFTYVEINQVGVDDALTPQCQASVNVPEIAAGGTWSSDPIPFTDFSCPADRGPLDLTSIPPGGINLLVRVDAKDMVRESNESDNTYKSGVEAPPNLVIQSAAINFGAQTVTFTEQNAGGATAGAHLTYVEINQAGVDEISKPQCQASIHVPEIAAGGTWSPDPIPFANFSCPGPLGHLDLTTLASGSANLVVRADAKETVAESNESDNIYDGIQ